MSRVDEREAVIKLAEYLRKLAPYKIWYRTNYVLRSSEFFPTQPEIDLIICRIEKDEKFPPILAAEVKYVRSTKDGYINPSYYSGLDEALALLVLGFDNVLLIHLVEEKLLTTVFLNYAKTLSDIIRGLKLPIGYRVYALSVSDSDISFYRFVRSRTGSIVDLRSLWVEPPPNPLLTDNSDLGKLAKKNRKALARTLGIRLSSL